MLRVVFGIVAGLGLLAAVGTVLAKNLVYAALFLIAFFFLVACQFVLLEAEFLAVVQVLIYIGAVAVLMLFGIMLTRNIRGDETTGGPWWRKVVPALLAGGVLAVLLIGIRDATGTKGRPIAWNSVRSRPAAEGPRKAAIVDQSRAVGDQLMTRYAVPFEVAGLLLTAALVGAVALARNERDEPSRARIGEPESVATGDIP